MWVKLEKEFVAAFCALHQKQTGEALDQEKIDISECLVSPYAGYIFLRIRLSLHRPHSANLAYIVDLDGISYCLYSPDESKEFRLIQVHPSADDLYAINSLLKFRLTEDNISRYLPILGFMLSRPPVHLLSRLSMLEEIISGMNETEVERVNAVITGVLPATSDGTLNIDFQEKTHYLFWTYITTKVPAILQGELHITEVRLSTQGVPRMDRADRLYTCELYNDDDDLEYFFMNRSEALNSELRRQDRKLGRPFALLKTYLKLDDILSTALLPLFLSNLAIIFISDTKERVVYRFYEFLGASYYLRCICFIIGVATIVNIILRFFVIKLGTLFSSKIPGRIYFMLSSLKADLKMQRDRLGFFWTPLLFLSLIIKGFMSLCLLIYGLWIFPRIIVTSPPPNFGQAVFLTLGGIPVVGNFLEYNSIARLYTYSLSSGLVSKIMNIIVGSVFSTVILGIGVSMRAMMHTKKTDH